MFGVSTLHHRSSLYSLPNEPLTTHYAHCCSSPKGHVNFRNLKLHTTHFESNIITQTQKTYPNMSARLLLNAILNRKSLALLIVFFQMNSVFSQSLEPVGIFEHHQDVGDPKLKGSV